MSHDPIAALPAPPRSLDTTTTRGARGLPRALAACAALALALGAAATNEPDGSPFAELRYRYVGPIGNRVSAVTGVPGDPNVYFAGAASGGVFKSNDGGVHWRAVFDDQPVQSIGALAVAPSDPNVVWAGTGETFIRSNVVVGNGAYKSEDGGETWQHMGLAESGRIGRIVIDPRDPDVVFVAALGHCYGPQQQRGVFKTTDGGRTWRRVLFVDENTGAVDLVMDPSNPRILYAATWQMQIRTWGRRSGGPGSGIHRSTDGGETWVQLTEGGAGRDQQPPPPGVGRGTVRGEAGIVGHVRGAAGIGLPRGPLGKIGLAMSAANPRRVYALIETSSFARFAPVRDEGVLWRSDDGGVHWRLINRDHTLTQRPLYYTRAVVAPDDADEIHFLSVRHSRSLDGGRTIDFLASGGDNHDMWIDPLLPGRMIVGHDGGIAISTTRGASWRHLALPTAQVYHVTTDHRVPYFLYGNRQDGSSFRGPSNSRTFGRIPSTAWQSVGGCESGWAVPDSADENVVWSGCYEGILERTDLRTGHAQNVSVWPDNPEGWAAGDLRYRFQWTFPVAVSHWQPGVVYAGSQHVHRSADGGRSWQVISPDLTTGDAELLQKTGGLTPDDASPTYAAVLFAIAESPMEQGVIWAGSNDGLVHVTHDGGQHWQEVTPHDPSLPPLATVSSIEPSRHVAGKVYLAIDGHQVDSTAPQLFRSDDHGRSWKRIVTGIPDSPLSYTHVLREDPVRPGLLYAGTGNGLYASFDDGEHWRPLQNNLPHAPVHWLTVQEESHDLVVATYGRGFWILDDITPLRAWRPEPPESGVRLYRPRPAYRFLRVQAHVAPRDDPAAGDNPPYGASLHYRLTEPLPSDAPLRINILAADGTVLRSLSNLPRDAGLHRVWWDLRAESSRSPRLRTQPLEHPHAQFNEQGWRPLVEGSRIAPLAEPGEYTVRLTVGERTLEQPLTVRKDPNSAGTLEQIHEQTEFVTALRDELNRVVDLIDEIEWLRHQVDELQRRLRQQNAGVEAVDRALAGLDAELLELERELFDPRLSGGTASQDTLRWPRRLYAKIGSLAGYAQGTDFAPTSQQRQVHALYREQLAAAETRMQRLRERVAETNELLRSHGVQPLGGLPPAADRDPGGPGQR